MPDDRIVSALVGLAGACNNNAKTENTDALVIKALSIPNDGSCEAGIRDTAEEIRNEKFAVAPGCAICAAPCGNTSDYDMTRLYRAEPEIREAKQSLLAGLAELAGKLKKDRSRDPEAVKFLYKGLSYIGYDLGPDYFAEVLAEMREFLKTV